jgi:hypothetical protein
MAGLPVRWLHESFRLQSMICEEWLHGAGEETGMANNYEDLHLQGRGQHPA